VEHYADQAFYDVCHPPAFLFPDVLAENISNQRKRSEHVIEENSKP
jgi:hypothetical protein